MFSLCVRGIVGGLAVCTTAPAWAGVAVASAVVVGAVIILKDSEKPVKSGYLTRNNK
jgi:hypothetical protein